MILNIPTIPEALEQASTLHRAGRLTEAEQLYRQILDIKPDHADSLHLLGVIAHQRGRSETAVDLIGKAIKVDDRSADFHSNIGSALHALGRLDDAEAHYGRAIELDADHLDAHNNLGNALFKRGKFAEAAAQFGRAVMITPHDAVAHFNLGNALLAQGDFAGAIARYERAIALNPHWAEPYYNLGRIFSTLGRSEEAAAQFRRAIDRKPAYVEAYSNLGAALHQMGHLGEAQACARQALALRPPDPDAFNVCGTVLLALGRSEEAIGCFRAAVTSRPDDAALHSNLVFALNFSPTATAADHQLERAAWAKRHASRLCSPQVFHNNADPERRLRIGYVSSHFRRQAATYAFGAVIANHDPQSFEVTCYSDTAHEDDATRCLAERAERWHRTEGLDDASLAELVRADRIDILVDLVGHMRGHRLLVFARKPAPIQVTAWGEPNGTGLAAMDYLLADPVLVPAKERSLLVEEVVDLPNYLGFWLPQSVSEPKALPARSRGHITFGSFNRLDKVQEPVLARWAAILRGVPRSRLVLKERTLTDAGQKKRILTALAARGVTADRVSLLGWRDPTEQFEAYHDIDLALDPFPHNGAMTTLEALWMGVPVVACAGSTIPSRLTAASLTALGLTDFIAGDLEGYVDLAIAKAGDVEGLARLRASLRERMARSSVADPTRYARAVEAAYRQMWQRWCAARL
jgi:predicted O-linked N-acetylglucosamine transferase (SPINDLY family)